MQRQAPPFWKTIPIFRILILFIFGILLQEELKLNLFQLSLLLSATCICWASTYYKNNSWHYLNPFARGLILQSAIVVSGALLLFANQYKNSPEWMGYKIDHCKAWVAELEEPTTPKPNSIGGKASVIACFSNGRWQPVKGKLLVYFKKDATATLLNYGSRFVFGKLPQIIRSTGNPGSFDFASYSARQQRFHQVYLSKDEYRLLSKKGGILIYHYLYKLRQQMLLLFRKYITNKEELGLTEALVLGVKDELNKELVAAYAATGTVHIIAISGLHLGLIYWLLHFLLGKLPLPKRLLLLKSLLIMAGLWGFALLAGGGPSVLRSAIMFSLVILAGNLFRYASTLNSLSVAAFLLLIYNPYWLWDTGFQLSFAAVLSIAIFQQPIYEMFTCKHVIVDKIWSATAVTLAAQLLTLPFCLYYFHQFPVYFLFTNLLAVPLSSLILLVALLLLAVTPYHTLAQLVSDGLHWLLLLLNGFIRFMESLPYSSWKPLQISLSQSLALAACIVLFSLFLFLHKKIFAWSTFACIGVFFTLRLISFRESAQQKLLLIYQIPGYSLVEYVVGHHSIKLILPGKTKELNTMNDPSFAASVLYRYHCIKTSKPDSLTSLALNFGLRKMVVLQSDFRRNKLHSPTNSDWLMITAHCKGKPEKILAMLHPKFVLLDGSNPFYRLKEWKLACKRLHVTFYSTEEQGAFVMPLE